MRQAGRIAFAGTVLVVFGALLGDPWRSLLIWFGATWWVIALAVHNGWTHLLGKTPQGRIPWWSYLLFFPWHFITQVTARAHRRSAGPAATEVAPGLWVGGWPKNGDLPPQSALIDLTCELPKRFDTPYYLCIPTWDAMSPSVESIDAAAVFIAQHYGKRPILVHCAHGRGRSVLTLAAAMVELGIHPDWRTAFTDIGKKRLVRMSRIQTSTITAWGDRRTPPTDSPS